MNFTQERPKKERFRFIKTFYFIRHGETDWNKNNLFQGKNDIPLNENGRRQAKLRAEKLPPITSPIYFSSPLVRALETATIVTGKTESEIIRIPEFMECDSPVAARTIMSLRESKTMPSTKYLRGHETVDDFFDRVAAGLEKVFQRSEGKTPVIFAHGGTGTAFCHLLKIPFFKIPNCHCVEFRKIGEKFKALPQQFSA